MATLILDNDCNKDDSVFMNIINDSLMNKKCTPWPYNASVCDEENQDFLRKPQAPPPSPQQTPLLDFFKLEESLETVLFDKEHDPLVKHAKALDRILRKHQHCVYKKKQKRNSAFKHIKKQEDVLCIINELKEMGLHNK